MQAENKDEVGDNQIELLYSLLGHLKAKLSVLQRMETFKCELAIPKHTDLSILLDAKKVLQKLYSLCVLQRLHLPSITQASSKPYPSIKSHPYLTQSSATLHLSISHASPKPGLGLPQKCMGRRLRSVQSKCAL